MTKEKMRVKLAEWAGIEVPVFGCDLDNECYCDCLEVYNETMASIPNYPEDLNALQSLEEKLTDEQWNHYCNHLSLIANGELCDGEFGTYRIRKMMALNAENKCIAMSKTLGLWEEERKDMK